MTSVIKILYTFTDHGRYKILFSVPKIVFSVPKIVFSVPKILFSVPKIVFSVPKIIFSVPTKDYVFHLGALFLEKNSVFLLSVRDNILYFSNGGQ